MFQAIGNGSIATQHAVGSKHMFLRRTIGLVTAFAMTLASSAASAQGLIRDAEIERTLKIVMQPILKAAGTSGSRVKIYIVNDRSLNAFVAGGSNIFVHAGLIRKLKSVEMLQAVLAHELGHINGGHLSQRAVQISSARTAIGLGLLLGVAAAAAGGGAGVAIGAPTRCGAACWVFPRTGSQC